MMHRGMIGFMLLLCAAGSAHGAERLRFWNLTSVTLKELYLAPAGTTQWSANQCKNDKDGTVDHDERLTITGVSPGRFDVKLADTKGRLAETETRLAEAVEHVNVLERALDWKPKAAPGPEPEPKPVKATARKAA